MPFYGINDIKRVDNWHVEYKGKRGLASSLEVFFREFYDERNSTSATFADYMADNADLVRSLAAEVCCY